MKCDERMGVCAYRAHEGARAEDPAAGRHHTTEHDGLQKRVKWGSFGETKT